MGDIPNPAQDRFSKEEWATLHSLAEMFSDKEARDELRRMLDEGATFRELVMAYKTNRRVISALKTTATLIVLASAAIAALKSLSLWPR